jgi:hypothetical protein
MCNNETEGAVCSSAPDYGPPIGFFFDGEVLATLEVG